MTALSFKIMVANKYKLQKIAEKLKPPANKMGSDISTKAKYDKAEVIYIV